MALGITSSKVTKGGTVQGNFVNERLVVNGTLDGSRVGYFTFPEKGLYFIHFSFMGWLSNNTKGYVFYFPSITQARANSPYTTVTVSLLYRVTDISQQFVINGAGTDSSGTTIALTIAGLSLYTQCVKLFD